MGVLGDVQGLYRVRGLRIRDLGCQMENEKETGCISEFAQDSCQYYGSRFIAFFVPQYHRV